MVVFGVEVKTGDAAVAVVAGADAVPLLDTWSIVVIPDVGVPELDVDANAFTLLPYR